MWVKISVPWTLWLLIGGYFTPFTAGIFLVGGWFPPCVREMLEKKLDRISPGKWRNQICLEKVGEKNKTSAFFRCVVMNISSGNPYKKITNSKLNKQKIMIASSSPFLWVEKFPKPILGGRICSKKKISESWHYRPSPQVTVFWWFQMSKNLWSRHLFNGTPEVWTRQLRERKKPIFFGWKKNWTLKHQGFGVGGGWVGQQQKT